MWAGFTFCDSCSKRHNWELNPDKPIEWQAVYSSKPLPEDLD